MAQSNYRPKGERRQIAVFALGSFDRREEVRIGGFSDLLWFYGQVRIGLRIFSLTSVLRLSQKLTLKKFDSDFAAKLEFDSE